MIVPAPRSLFVVGAVLTPIAVGVGLIPGYQLAGLLALALVVAVAVLDLSFSVGVTKGIQITLPEVVRLNRRVEGVIPLTIEDTNSRNMKLAAGLPLPASIETEVDQIHLELRKGEGALLVEIPCTPRERGEYVLDAVYLSAPSPLGLWEQRSRVPVDCDLRVFPDLSRERRHVSALFLRGRSLGAQVVRQVGKGREFEKLREYQPGDSYEDIHWKATARRGSPITKLYQIERTQEVYICLDHGRLSGRRLPADEKIPEAETIIEQMLRSAMLLAAAAQHQGDKVGVITFADRITEFVKSGQGQAHYQACRNAVYTLTAKPVSSDYLEFSGQIHARLRKRALIIVLTCLDDPVTSEQCAESLKMISRRHLVLVLNIKPAVARPVFSGSEVVSRDDVYRSVAGHSAWKNLQWVERELHQHGIMVQQVDRGELTPALVSSYMDIKQRQLV